MAEYRKRRIVKRAAIVGVTVVLLPMGYVSAYISLHWPYGQGMISWAGYAQLSQTVFWPAGKYAESSLPGGHLTERMCRWMYGQGSGVPVDWEESGDPERKSPGLGSDAPDILD